MAATTTRRVGPGRLIVALGAAALAFGCSSGSIASASTSRAAELQVSTGVTSGPQTARQRTMEAVVRAWSKRLNAGDNVGIARLFALPAVLVQGPYVYRLLTRHQLALWHAALPCAGAIVSITYQGRFATAVFKLANRGSTHCDAPGTLAAARFEIVDGKIASWQQVTVPPKQDPAVPVA